MDWRDIPSLAALRAFEAAARTRSLSAAARELNVTHAAISQHVRGLEAHFGTGLLIRDGQQMKTTEPGEALAASLTDGFSTIAVGVRDLLDRDRERPLRVAVTPAFAANWLMPRLGAFWAAHPDVELEILPGIGLSDLRQDQIDVAIRYGRGNWPGVEERPLLSARFLVVAKPGYVSDRQVTSLADLQDETWLIETGRQEERFFAEANGLDLTRARMMNFATAELSRQAALQGLGLSVMAAPLVEEDVASGRLEVLFAQRESKVSYHILTRPETVRPARDAFIKWLIGVAKDADNA